ncbi:MAG: ArnT family glycosyltransferase [Promethearchaeota archaeon]
MNVFEFRFQVRKTNLFLIMLIILGLALRMMHLDGPPVWDEAYYITHSEEIKLNPFKHPVWGGHPPLYAYLLFGVHYLFGSSIFAYRMLSVVLGTLTIIVVFYFGKLLYDETIGVFAAFILSILPPHVIMSRLIMMDIILTFFSILALYGWIAGEMKDSRILMIFGSLSGVCAILTKEPGILIPIIFILWCLLQRKFSLYNALAVLPAYFVYAIWKIWAVLADYQYSAHGVNYTALDLITQRAQFESLPISYVKIFGEDYLLLFFIVLLLTTYTFRIRIQNRNIFNILLPVIFIVLLGVPLGFYLLQQFFSLPPTTNIIDLIALSLCFCVWGLLALHDLQNDAPEKLLFIWSLFLPVVFMLNPKVSWQYLLPISPALAILIGKELLFSFTKNWNWKLLGIITISGSIYLFIAYDLFMSYLIFSQNDLLTFLLVA